MGVGWDLSLRGLMKHLAGETLDPAKELAWPASAEGKAFIVGTSNAWCDASIASGTPRHAAEAAAAATTGFYTGAG